MAISKEKIPPPLEPKVLIASIYDGEPANLSANGAGLIVLRTSNGAAIGLASNGVLELHRWRLMNQAMFEPNSEAVASARRPGAKTMQTIQLPQQQQRQHSPAMASPTSSAAVRGSWVPPLNDRVAHLEHALALHEAASAATGAHYPVDCVKRIMRRFRPVCYVCTLMVPEDSETRMCYVCGLSWWSRFESTLEQRALAAECLATAAAATR